MERLGGTELSFKEAQPSAAQTLERTIVVMQMIKFLESKIVSIK